MSGESRPTVLITGASSGIGQALAECYAHRAHDLVLVARRLDRLEQLGKRLTDSHGIQVTPFAADLALPTAAADLESRLGELDIAVDVLVNNAGYGVPGAYLSSPWSVHRDFLQVMQTAVAELCHRFAAPMKARGQGHIINVASLAGLMPSSAGHTLYGPVKSWMIRFSECLDLELAPHGVRVMAACPGFTYTEFHDVNHMRASVSQMPGYLWMDADRVARAIVEGSLAGRRTLVIGRINRILAGLARALPHGLMRRIVAGQVRHYRNTE